MWAIRAAKNKILNLDPTGLPAALVLRVKGFTRYIYIYMYIYIYVYIDIDR